MNLGWVVFIEGIGSKARLWEDKKKEIVKKAVVDNFNEECLRMMFLKGAVVDKSSVHKPNSQRK